MSGWTRASLSTALKAAGVASTLGWVLVLMRVPRWRIRIRLPAIQGLSRAPLRGRTRHRSPARRPSGRRVRPCQRLDGGCGPADHRQLPRAGR